MDNARREDVAHVESLLAAGDLKGLDAFLSRLHPADIADLLQEFDSSIQLSLLKRIDRDVAAEVFTEVDRQSGQSLLLLLSDRDVVELLGEMQSDDAADIMSTLPPERSERVEALLPTEDRTQIQELMEFDEDSAGGIMEVERIAVPDDATIGDAVELVREASEDIENLQKIYVVDAAGHLCGHLSVLDLLLNPRHSRIGSVMETNIISVPVDMDQEHVAALFGKYDEFTLPVVDRHNVLVGRITVDDIIDVMEEEASEDITYMAGTTEEELGESSPLKISRARLPWLVTGMLGELLNAFIISRHEVTLQTFVTLAFFVPLIVGTAGNVGVQAAVVVVRELALGQIDAMHVWRRLGREFAVVALNGVILAALLFAVVAGWRHDVGLAFLLAGSLLSVLTVAGFIGAVVPLMLNRWRIDPAIATGPFITVSNDIVGLAIYLGLASLYLRHVG